MKDDYSDIIDMPHHVSTKYPRTSSIDRAAQFGSFAALTGHSDMINETARWTSEKMELNEDEKNLLDIKQSILRQAMAQRPIITVTYFVPDSKKSGGCYVDITGIIKREDHNEGCIIFENGEKILFDNVINIISDIFLSFPGFF